MNLDQLPLDEIEAVLFDVGGVFFIPNHAVLRPILDELSVSLHDDDAAAFHRAHYSGVRHDPREQHDDTFWAAYNHRYVDALGIGDTQRSLAARALRDVWLSGLPLWTWRQDEAADALARVARHRRVGIVSNADGTVEAMLQESAICQIGHGAGTTVEVIVDSTVVGIAKPDPAIFDHALRPMGLRPERVLYVGDTYRYDVVGARAAGLKVLLLDPYGLHDDDDVGRLDDLAQLADALEAASR